MKTKTSIKLSLHQAQALDAMLQLELNEAITTTEDKLLNALYAEVLHRVRTKMVEYQEKYTIGFTISQAIAIAQLTTIHHTDNYYQHVAVVVQQQLTSKLF